METIGAPSCLPRIRAGLIALLVVAACSEDVAQPAPGDETLYVDIMTRLYLIDERPPQTGTLAERARAGDSLRAEVLRTNGLEPDDLIALSGDLGSDPARMQVLWETISAQVDSLVEAHDSVAAAARDSATESTRFQTVETDGTAKKKKQTARPDSLPPGTIFLEPDSDADSAVQEKIRRLQERAKP